MGHFRFLSIFLFLRNIIASSAPNIAINFRGRNTAESFHFRHRMIAELPRNRFLAAT
jgi:hypothetical protein